MYTKRDIEPGDITPGSFSEESDATDNFPIAEDLERMAAGVFSLPVIVEEKALVPEILPVEVVEAAEVAKPIKKSKSGGKKPVKVGVLAEVSLVVPAPAVKVPSESDRIPFTFFLQGEEAEHVNEIIRQRILNKITKDKAHFVKQAVDFAINSGRIFGKKGFGVPEKIEPLLLKNGYFKTV